MSLRRLGVERIDLFQLHRIDPKVPTDDQFGVLRDLQKEGKIRHVGLSEVNVAEIEAARRILDEDHYGLEDVKERILEFLAVRQLTQATEREKETEAAAEAEPTPEPGPEPVSLGLAGGSIISIDERTGTPRMTDEQARRAERAASSRPPPSSSGPRERSPPSWTTRQPI